MATLHGHCTHGLFRLTLDHYSRAIAGLNEAARVLERLRLRSHIAALADTDGTLNSVGRLEGPRSQQAVVAERPSGTHRHVKEA